MKQTKGAIGNLLNRYRAVLKKCHLLNTFGSLAVASMLVMGGVGVAQAADNEKYPLNGVSNTVTITGESTLTFTPDVEGAEAQNSASKDIIGGYWVNDSLTDGGENVSTSITIQQGENVEATYKGEVIGGSLIQGAANTAGSVTVNDTRIVIEEGASIGGDDNKGKFNNVMAGGKVNGYGTSEVTGTATLIVNGTVEGTAIGGGTAKKPTDQANDVVASVGTTEVTINGTVNYGVVGGGVSDAYGAAAAAADKYVTSKVSTTNVTINEGATVESLLQPSSKTSISAAVAGGGLASGSNALVEAGTTNVFVNGGEISDKVVAGGTAINGGKVKVDHTNLTMTGGDVSSDLVGGNLLSGGTEEAGISSTNVHVTGGTVHSEIYGGTYVRNTGAAAEVDAASVTIDGGTMGATEPQSWAQYVVGGGKAMSNGNYTAQSDVTTTTVTITGGEIVRGAVIGGGFTRAQGTAGGTATATVENATVAVSGGSLSGVVAGGLAESTASSTDATSSSTVTTANLNISGNAKVNGIRYMANDQATDGKFEETPASDIAVVGGGLAYSMNGMTATSAVTKSNTSISGGTINGSVVAGGMANGSSATASVTTANLDITVGTINGSVYAGGASLESGTVNVDSFAVMITGGTITGDVVAGNYTTPDQTNLAMIATLADETTTTTSGTITIGGTADVQGGVVVNDSNVVTTIDGSEATVEKGFTSTGTNNTLAFENYTATFDKTATGFENYNAGAGSTVTVATISTGSATEGQTGLFAGNTSFILGGEGTFVAQNVTVDDSDSLNVAGTLNVAGEESSVTVSSGGKLNINNGGTVDVTQANSISAAKADIAVNAGGTLEIGTDQIATSYGATLASGATVNVIGDGETELDASTLASKFGTNGSITTGIVNVENAQVDGIFTDDVDLSSGTVARDDIEVMGIATEDTRKTVVTGSKGSDMSGEWHAVKLDTGVTELQVAGKDLQLVGTTERGNLIEKTDGMAGDLRIGSETGGINPATATVTLGDANAPNKGTIGNVVLNAGSGNNATLRVVGNGQGADFTIGNVRANSSTNAIEVAGATLHTGNITTDQDTTALHTLSVDHGDVLTDGNANVQDVVLSNYGTFTATSTTTEGVTTGGEITINGILSGQGLVRADEALTFDGLTTADGADLRLESKEISTGNLDSTVGKVTIVATENLTTTGGATLNNDVVLAQNWTLASTDAVKASGKSYQLVGQFSADSGADPEGVSSLNTTYTVKDQSMLVHVSDPELDSANEAALGQLRAELDNHGFKDRPAYLTDQTLNLTSTGKLVVGTDSRVSPTTTDRVIFGENSVLAIDADVIGDAVFTAADAAPGNTATAYVADSSSLYVENATADSDITIFGTGFGDVTVEGWTNIQTDTDMLKGSYKDKKATFEVQDAGTVFPGLSEDLAPAVNDLYKGSLNDVDSEYMGIQFLSRATNNRFLGSDKQAAASTIESAARMAFAGAVPQMTKMASDSATNSVVNRMGFANPENGAKAMNVDGKLVDDKALGLALWIAPLWSNQTGFGMEAGNLDYGYNANIGGISLGADYTWANNFRAGLMFNIGGGYAESSGDLSETTNSMTFWGVGAYGGWKYENFAVMGDVSYTSTWNSVDQDVDYRMGMGDLESDIQASAISAGLRFEYKLETQYLDLIPHVGARYMSINTWGYDVETNGGTVLEGDGFQQNIWTFPVGITFSKELEMNNDWYFKPSVDFTVIPAAGDIKAKEDVLFTGMQRSYEVETQMMDYFTWQGGVGLEFGNDNMSVGVNYTLQAGQNSTGHGVFGMFRYEF